MAREDYARWMKEVGEPFYATGIESQIAGVGGVSLATRTFVHPSRQSLVVVATGRSENLVKYAEFAYNLFGQGHSVLLFDHRGQGLSGRVHPDPHRGHVARFSDYVDDLDAIWRMAVTPLAHPNLFLFGHSMGGLVAAHWLAQHPDAATGAILASPMLRMRAAPLPFWLLELIVFSACRLGFDRHYALGQGPFSAALPFAENTWATCEERFRYAMALQRSQPELNLGGPTFGWVAEALKASSESHALAAHIACPILLLTSPDDVFVDNAGAERFLEHARHAIAVTIDGSCHEILSSPQDVRDKALSEIARFIKAAMQDKPRNLQLVEDEPHTEPAWEGESAA